MKRIIVLLLSITTTYLHSSDTQYIYSSISFNDFIHGEINSNEINANKWDISSGFNIGNNNSSIDFSIQYNLYNVSTVYVDSSALTLDQNSQNITGNDEITTINIDLHYKTLYFGLELGEQTSMYGNWEFSIFPGISLGIKTNYNGQNYMDWYVFDSFNLSLDNIITEFGTYYTHNIGDLFWSLESNLLSISNRTYEDKIQARYDLSKIPSISSEISYNFTPIKISLDVNYIFIEPFDISFYHDNIWFGSMDINENSYFINTSVILGNNSLEFRIDYDYYKMGETMFQVESRAFVYGPLAYKKAVFSIPDLLLQKLGGTLSMDLFNFTIETSYNRYLLNKNSIAWNYYNFIWAGLFPKVSYASPDENYILEYNHLNTINLDISYERTFFDRFNINISINQLIPFFDSISEKTDNISDSFNNFDIDGGRSYTLEFNIRI